MQNRIHIVLPYGIMGVICLVAGGLCMTLPETMGVPTADTIEVTPGSGEENGNLLLEEKPKQKGVDNNEKLNSVLLFS